MKAAHILSRIGNILNSIVFGFLWIGALSQYLEKHFPNEMLGYLIWFSLILLLGWIGHLCLRHTSFLSRVLLRCAAVLSLINLPASLLLFIASFIAKKQQMDARNDDDPDNDWSDY